jgi:hypothetical protein
MSIQRLRRLFAGLSPLLAAGSIPFTLAALTLVLVPKVSLSDDELPIRGGLAVNFTANQTSPGVFSIAAKGIGNTSRVGNLLFDLHKTIDFNNGSMQGTFVMTAENGDTLSGTYAGVIGQPDSKGFTTFSGQLAFTAGTGRLQDPRGTVSFTGLANLGTGQAVYSFKGAMSSPGSGGQ